MGDLVVPNGTSWSGRIEHEGHTITKIEEWPTRIDGATVEFHNGEVSAVRGGVLTCGRVRCTCGKEWNVSGWPTGVRVPAQPGGNVR